MIDTMRWEKGKLILLDQTKLPQLTELITCEDYKRVKLAIKRLEVRGAPAIGAAAGFGMVLGALEAAKRPDFLGTLDKIKENLISARPTAVNLEWAAKKVYALAVKLNEEGLAPFKIIAELEKLAVKIYNDDIAVNKKMGEYGAEVLPQDTVLL
ncbi:MAG: S-methyl-5-thioribose-1-phosphate isomerase, partial [Phascolarctobacterium sp.]|nr:S-methyl-5-thioribose-1-phosphate isomerase [Phascolarctobacterium sp.]